MTTTNAISINSLNIAPGSGYLSTLVQSYVQPGSTVSWAQRDGESPLATNAAPGVLECILTIIVDARGIDADTVDARRRALLRELDTSRAPLTLVIRNATGTARERYMRFIVVKADQVVGQYGEGFAVQLNSADDARWRSTTLVEETHQFTDAEGGWALQCLGDLETYPTYTATPRAPNGAPVFPYFVMFTVYWPSPWGGEHWVDVTDGGINTAALKTAGKVTNSGNIGISMDGQYTPFWYGGDDGQPGGFNSTTTRMWVRMRFNPATQGATTRLTTETDTTIYVRGTGSLPTSGTARIGAEYVTYTHHTNGALYGVQRGQYGTTADSHAAGTAIAPIQVGYIFYGPNGAIPDATIGDDYNMLAGARPIFINSGSTNAAWNFDGVFNDPDGAANWSYSQWGNVGTAFVSASDASGAYNPDWVLPWTAMGFKPGWASWSGFDRSFAVPIGLARVVGRRYAAGSPSQYPGSPKLLYTNTNTGEWQVAWDSAQGIERTPNPTFDVTTPAADAARTWNRLVWGFENTNFSQVDIQQLVVYFRSNYIPQIELSDEDTGYDLSMRLWNNTTGEALLVEYPNMQVDHGIVIDSEQMTVSYDNRAVYAAVRRGGNPIVRPYFLRLVPGTNQLHVEEDGISQLEIKVSYTPRWYA